MRLGLALLILSTSALAHNSASRHYSFEKLAYANIYVDSLIEKFDKRLDEKINTADKTSVLSEMTYAKLLSGRSYIESFKDYSKSIKKSYSVLNIQNSDLYNQVVTTIDKDAIRIKKINTKRFRNNKADSVIYPSISKAGNLTGNTFPKKVWSLTFDDGPRGVKTKTIVDALYSRGIKATFFMLTAEAKKYKSTAQYVLDSGMNIALHSYTHPNLVKATTETLEYEITVAKKDLENLLNVKTSVFRLPYGSGMRSTEIRQKIAINNYVHIFWNVDTLDWKDKDPKSILERTKKQMKLSKNDAGIILYHDIHNQSVIASELTMDHLINNNYKVCTVEEVIEFFNGISTPCVEN